MATEPAFWDNLAESYAAKPVEDPAAFDRKTEVTLSYVTESSTVLDIGCGTGSFALRLAPHAGHVHGLDYSTEMIRIARDKAQDVGNVTFHCAPFDEQFTALEPGSVDVFCAYSLLHLMTDRVAALRRARSLMKPGAVFVSSTVCLGESWLPYRPLLTVMRWFGKAPVVAILTKAQVVAELEQAGFVDVQEVDVGAESTIGFITARSPV